MSSSRTTCLDIYGWQTVTEMNTDIETWLRNTAMSEFLFVSTSLKTPVVSDAPEKVLEHQRGLLVFYYRYADAYGMTLEERSLAEYMGIATVNEVACRCFEETKEAAEFYLSSFRRSPRMPPFQLAPAT